MAQQNTNGHHLTNGHNKNKVNGQTNGVHQLDGSKETALSSITQLGSTIARNATALSRYLEANNLPKPSSEADGPAQILNLDAPLAVQEARQAILAATLQLYNLTAGPSEFLPSLAVDFNYLPCLSWLCHYDIFHKVPLQGSISYDDLSSAVAVSEQRLKSIIRMTMTRSLFQEEVDGTHIRHSATSAYLAQNEDAHAYACWLCERTAPMAMHMTAAHERWGPGSTSATETAYNSAFDTELPFFKHLQLDKSVTEGFAKYMRAVRSSDSISLKHLINGHDWQSVRESGTVVDVGGSSGDAAIALATAFPHLSFVVEDLAENVETGRTAIAKSQGEGIKSRVEFRQHDFMQPQPVRAADVYLLRMILHDWPDDKAREIIHRLVEAMDPTKSVLLIMDTVLPKAGSVPVSAERITRLRDLTMMQAFNAKERELEDWEALITSTNSRLKLRKVTHPVGSAMSLLEIVLS